MLRSFGNFALRATKSQVKCAVNVSAKRFLGIHEYQSKEVLRKFGVETQKGDGVSTVAEAEKAAQKLDSAGVKDIIVKAQIHAGGRGKGTFKNGFYGGVHMCSGVADVTDKCSKMLDQVLVTKQTGEKGILVSKLFVGEAAEINSEKYFAILMDREHNGPVIVSSPQGGMDIEAVAEASPEAIFSEPINIFTGPTAEQLNRVADNLEFKLEYRASAIDQMSRLYKLFIETDCTMLEINPLAESDKGRVLSADAKITFDDNAQFRQQDYFNYRDRSQEDPREVAASEYNLNYIGLDGNIGCMVNGAGLAMATMDIIKLHGGEPANFLDVGGGATEENVTQAFKILTSDPNVKALLVNIFGGIMKCDTIALGIVGAAKEVGLKIPLVVRLEGTNVEIGKQILKDSGLPIITADDLDAAAIKAVATLS